MNYRSDGKHIPICTTTLKDGRTMKATTVMNGTFGLTSAYCPAGQIAIGGGNIVDIGVSGISVLSSNRHATDDKKWEVLMRNDSGANFTATAYAYCVVP